jgi:hypothetical protein
MSINIQFTVRRISQTFSVWKKKSVGRHCKTSIPAYRLEIYTVFYVYMYVCVCVYSYDFFDILF